jgi:hypothetical protein
MGAKSRPLVTGDRFLVSTNGICCYYYDSTSVRRNRSSPKIYAGLYKCFICKSFVVNDVVVFQHQNTLQHRCVTHLYCKPLLPLFDAIQPKRAKYN